MHLLRTLTISTLTLASLGAQAFELTDELSFNVTPAIVSDYRTNGLSQTQGNPAAQLNLILQHASGLYAGVWTSNVDFGYDSKTRQEIEYYAGYYWQMTDDISLDTWLTKYEFPREGQYNQSDIQSTLDVYGVLLGGKYASDVKGPDYYDENGLEVFNDTHEEEDFSSWFVGYQTHLPMDIGLRATYETVDYKDDVFYTSNGSSRADYNNWEVRLNKELWHLDWSLSYIDTDLSDSECESFMGYRDVCSATVVAGVSTTF